MSARWPKRGDDTNLEQTIRYNNDGTMSVIWTKKKEARVNEIGTPGVPKVQPEPVPQERRGFGWYLDGRVITVVHMDGKQTVLALTDARPSHYTYTPSGAGELMVYGTWTPAEPPKWHSFPLVNVRSYSLGVQEIYRDFPCPKAEGRNDMIYERLVE